jgi:hypothetical protein
MRTFLILILDGDEWSSSNPMERASDIGQKPGLDDVAQEHISTPARTETWLIQPTA